MSETHARGPPRRLTTDEVLQVLEDRDRDKHPVMTAEQIRSKGKLEPSKRTVLNRLEELREAGEVEHKQAGKSRIWWLPGEKLVDQSAAELTDALAEGVEGEVSAEEVIEAVEEKREREKLDKDPVKHYKQELEQLSREYVIVFTAGGLIFLAIMMLATEGVFFDPLEAPEYWGWIAGVSLMLGIVIFGAYLLNAAAQAVKETVQNWVREEREAQSEPEEPTPE